MKNVREANLKKCIFLTTDEFESIIKSLFGYSTNITYEMDGMTIHEVNDGTDDAIDTNLLHDRLAKYFDVEKITSIHIDDCEKTRVWIVYKGGYSGPNLILDKEPPYEIAIEDLQGIQDSYIEGYGYEAHPTDTWYAIDFAIKSMQKLQKIEEIIKDHDNNNMPEDYFYIDKIREVLRDEK